MEEPVPLGERIRCHLQNHGAGTLIPGEDLLLEAPTEHLIEAPEGTLLDDLFTADDRAALESEAFGRLAAWREAHDEQLTVGSARLAWIWEMELLAEVFLPEVRTVAGLVRVARRASVGRVELIGADRETAECLDAALRSAGVEVEVRGVADRPVPSYPGRRANPWPRSLASRLRGAALRPWGIPPLVRGNVLFVPYWHLFDLHRRLLTEPGLTPLHDPFRIPPGPLGGRLRAAATGGWVGRPNALQSRRSRGRVLRALDAMEPVGSDDDSPLGTLLDRRARRLLEQRAGNTPALAEGLERALRRRRVRAVRLAFDSPPDVRTVLTASRAAHRPSLVVQHGYLAESNDPDKAEADLAAVWSEGDRELLGRRRAGPITVTGNPGVDGLARLTVEPRDRTLILPAYMSRVSLRLDPRVTARFLEVALEGLSRARPGTAALLRPHPADLDLEAHEGLAQRFPELEVEIDSSSSIYEVISRCDLCLSGVSTAALQAGIAGLPVIFLDVSTDSQRWPFNGGPDAFFTAADTERLTAQIPEALARRGQTAPEALDQALGVRHDAQDRVVAALRELVEGGPT